MSGLAPKPGDQSTVWPHEDVKDAQGDLKRQPDANSPQLGEALEESFPASDPPSMTQPKPSTSKPGDADTSARPDEGDDATAHGDGI